MYSSRKQISNSDNRTTNIRRQLFFIEKMTSEQISKELQLRLSYKELESYKDVDSKHVMLAIQNLYEHFTSVLPKAKHSSIDTIKSGITCLEEVFKTIEAQGIISKAILSYISIAIDESMFVYLLTESYAKKNQLASKAKFSKS